MDRVLSPAERERRKVEAQKVKAYQKDVNGTELDEDFLMECVDRFGSAENIILTIVNNALPADLAEQMQEWKPMRRTREDAPSSATTTTTRRQPSSGTTTASAGQRPYERATTSAAATSAAATFTPTKQRLPRESLTATPPRKKTTTTTTPSNAAASANHESPSLSSDFKCWVGHVEDTSLDDKALKTILEKTLGVEVRFVETPGVKENGQQNGKYCFATFANKADAARAVATSEHVHNNGPAPDRLVALPKNPEGGGKGTHRKFWTFRFAQLRPQDVNKEEVFRRTEQSRRATELQTKELSAPGRVDVGEVAKWRLKLYNASNDKLSLRKFTTAPRRRELDVRPQDNKRMVVEAQSSAYLKITFGPATRYGIFRSLLVLEFDTPNARGGSPVKKTAFPEISVDVSPDPASLVGDLEDVVDDDAKKRGHDGQGVWDGKQRTVVATVPPEVRRGLGLHVHTPEDVDWQRKLPWYEIPEDIQAKVDETGRASGFCPWLKRDDEQFKKRLHALLWTEEAQLIKNFRKFDIANATFEPDFANPKKVLHRLEVPGLAERRPSLLKGDLVYAWQPDTEDVEYEGWIANVEQSTILVAFADIFHDHYQRHLHNEIVKFREDEARKRALLKDVEAEQQGGGTPPDDDDDDDDDEKEEDHPSSEKKKEEPQPRAGFHVRFTFPRIEHRRMHLAVDNVSLDLLWPQQLFPASVADPDVALDWYDTKIPNCDAQRQSVREIVALGTAPERFLEDKDKDSSTRKKSLSAAAAKSDDDDLAKKSSSSKKKESSASRGAEYLPAMLASATAEKAKKRSLRRDGRRPPPFLLSGAFGTGKTRTMVEAVWQTLRTDPDARILLCSETNSAADLIVEKLAEVLEPKDMLRLVHSHRNIMSVPLKSREYSPYDYEKRIFLTPNLHQILSYRVVVSTMMNAATLFGIGVPVDHFTHVFLEEAANALLPVALLPLTLACQSTVIVLVGDEKQVSPRVSSQSARHHGLEESLLTWFGRLRDDSVTRETKQAAVLKVELVENFRSHPLLLSLPSELFYENRLVSKAEGYPSNCLQDWKRLPKKGSPLLVVGVEGHEEQVPHSPSFFNKFEAAEVVRLIEELLNDHRSYSDGTPPLRQEDVAVVTAFHLQTVHVRSLLRKKHLHRVNVGGIQVLQGQEKKAVFVTTVRSRRQWVQYDKRHKLGFLFDEKKLNTALTRSIALLCVVGDPYVLMEEPKWRECLEKADAIGCYEGIPLNDEDYIKERCDREAAEQNDLRTRIDDEGFLTRLATAEVDQDAADLQRDAAASAPESSRPQKGDDAEQQQKTTTPQQQQKTQVVPPPPQPSDDDAAKALSTTRQPRRSADADDTATEAVPRAAPGAQDTSPPGIAAADRAPSPLEKKPPQNPLATHKAVRPQQQHQPPPQHLHHHHHDPQQQQQQPVVGPPPPQGRGVHLAGGNNNGKHGLGGGPPQLTPPQLTPLGGGGGPGGKTTQFGYPTLGPPPAYPRQGTPLPQPPDHGPTGMPHLQQSGGLQMLTTPPPVPTRPVDHLEAKAEAADNNLVPIRVLQWGSRAFAIAGTACPAFRSFVSKPNANAPGQSFLVVQVCTFGWQAHVDVHSPLDAHHTVVLRRLPDDDSFLLDPVRLLSLPSLTD